MQKCARNTTNDEWGKMRRTTGVSLRGARRKNISGNLGAALLDNSRQFRKMALWRLSQQAEQQESSNSANMDCRY
jgi:hypothetical protein